jgi:hypothetical protein
MYPKSADTAQVDELVRQTAAFFKQSAGFRSITTSVDSLMGPGAQHGDYGRLVMVDFETLDDALGAVTSDAFSVLRSASEQVAPTHFLFECREI